jgi:hypothetical protein
MKNEDIQRLADMTLLANFIQENKEAGKLPKETADKIEELVKKYRLNTVDKGTTIITADFGILGSIILREVIESEENYYLDYSKERSGYLSIDCKTRCILWTDFQDIEPYKRQSGLYCDGATFERLGAPVREEFGSLENPNKNYREFDAVNPYNGNISFCTSSFSYNDYYGSVSFGLCVLNEDVEPFLAELRQLIDK